jgi:hypothetical protein
VKVGAAVATSLWILGNVPAARRFSRALQHPQETQESWLRKTLGAHASSAFGRHHDFEGILTPAHLARRVPLSTWDDVEPWVERIRSGEQNILASEPTTHLAPTSGSSGAAKAIPFTASLQSGFDAAIGAWMCDLARQRPRLTGGRSYWSITPVDASVESPRVTRHPSPPDGIRLSVPDTGFVDDADYLGGRSAWLVRQALAVPSEVRHIRDIEAFRRLTLLALLRCRDLRLISVWHPSFIDLLVSAAETAWPDLLDAIEAGNCPWELHLPGSSAAHWLGKPDAKRASELRRIGPHDWGRWWPHLQVLSCWGEQAAESGWRRLVRQLPDVLVQPKGLLATEAVVTIPWRDATPLAVTSHYFEFIRDDGDVIGAHQLERGQSYEVVVTNGGGLWRYRLGDVVECTGHAHETPLLRFLGRAGRVSDLRGEKLSESFVASVIRGLWDTSDIPSYAALRARRSRETAGYELLISSDWLATTDVELAGRAEHALSANPHYAIARRLGQLEPLHIVRVDPDESRRRLLASPLGLGDSKPEVLLRTTD